MPRPLLIALVFSMFAPDSDRFREAAGNAVLFEEWAGRSQRVLHAWLKQADPKTLLLPDRIPGPGTRGVKPGDTRRLYTPHNSGADLYPYLILTADLTDPQFLDGRLLEMLRNEVRYTTTADSVPGELELATGKLGPPSLFGAGEYAKDGLVSVTELLGRTPWYYRMVDMTADAMLRAPVDSRFGRLPASDAELNGDYLQVLPRLYRMTGDPRFLAWGRRIADAYMDEVLPGNHGLPADKWDFSRHAGDARLRLRDHGNEIIVGLVLQFTLEQALESPRATAWKPGIEKMLDRVLESANPDGMLYDAIDAATLKPISKHLSDNWGYVYGAAYTFYQATGLTKYRDATRRVLANLPKYRNHDWESGSFDGYADSIESAIYLVNREPVPQAFDWIDSEMKVMGAMQRADGHIEYWYGEGNFNRTGLLYAYMKSQGCRPTHWAPGVGVGAVREGSRLYLNLVAPAGWQGSVRFDFARHRRVQNLERNYVRLNEFPEWFVVDENQLYRIKGKREEVRLGSELIAGIRLEPGNWTVAPLEKAK